MRQTGDTDRWWYEEVSEKGYLPPLVKDAYTDFRRYVVLTGEDTLWEDQELFFASFMLGLEKDFIDRAAHLIGGLTSLQASFPAERIRSRGYGLYLAKKEVSQQGSLRFREQSRERIIPNKTDLLAYDMSREVIASMEEKDAHRNIEVVYKEAYGPILRLVYRRVIANLLPESSSRDPITQVFLNYIDGVQETLDFLFWKTADAPDGDETRSLVLMSHRDVGEAMAKGALREIKRLEKS